MRKSSALLAGLWAVTCVSTPGLPGPAAGGAALEPPEYGRLRDQAEAFYAEGSFARALELYRQAQELELAAPESRWVAFRVADTLWRSQAGTQTHDQSIFEDARTQLEALIGAIPRADDRDLVWAEANESLGDFWWSRTGSQNWSAGWPHYHAALDWWAGARDVDLARTRYLAMVWRMADPAWMRQYNWYYHGSIPLEILENARTIAETPNDRAAAHFLLAMGLSRSGGSWPQRQRVEREFEAALEFGTENPWYDDALYHYAQWLAGNGRAIMMENGQWRSEPDYVRALALYRQLTQQFRKGTTRYFDDARSQIRQITERQITASVSNVFLPGSEIQFDLNWRNVKTVELTLSRVDLTRHVDPTFANRRQHEWISQIDLADGEPVKAWTFDTKDSGEHAFGHETIRLDETLPIGAYVVEAASGGKKARDLVLVTDVAVVVKTWNDQVLAYVCNALDGSPVPDARVHLWDYRFRNDRWTGADKVGASDGEGLARFTIDARTRPNEYRSGYLLTVNRTGRQAFAVGGFGSVRSPSRTWKIYASTDRPAYRPEDTVNWKLTARTYDGSVHSTPGGQSIEYEIAGPRGKVGEGTCALNAFGSAWGSLELDKTMALGEYNISFWTKGRHDHIGSARLFRLEEYKLPEFEVAVKTPEEGGRTKTFRLGETVEVEIQADYYFGGPVASANVEVVVRQNPFWHTWMPPRDYPWCYENPNQWNHWWGGSGQVIKQETLTTDETGHARLTFETPAGGGQDFEYQIEARVTDTSRREITGSGTVRVTRQRYYVYPRAEHNLYEPGDKVEVTFKSLDANSQPVSVEGTVKVTREKWIEIWIAPDGKEITGARLDRVRRQIKSFPPPPEPGRAPWQLKFRGYSSEEILTQTLETDEKGEATLTFTPDKTGYYRVNWTSEDPGSIPITAQTTVWVARRDSVQLGYHPGGVEIIVDKDTFRAGQTAAVMLSVPTNNRYVLFTIEGEDLHSYQLVHVPGTVKLLQIPIDQRHVPNVTLQAAMVANGQMFADSERIVVPPVEHFLDVEIRADREAYEPRDEGSLTILTRDVDGKPVSAEVAVSLVDESVYYIQTDYAPDPREFFFNDRQQMRVSTGSTFQYKTYARLVQTTDDQVIDERMMRDLKREQELSFPSRRGDRLGKSRGRRAEGGGAFGDDMDMAFNAGVPAEAMDLMDNGTLVQRMSAKSAMVPGRAGEMLDRLGQDPNAQQPAVVVRSDFRSTILWQPDLVTDETGRATVKVDYADSLTRWKATARATTTGNQVGIGQATTRTRKPLIARLQAPRFFVVGDLVTLSGVFNNNTEEPMNVRPALEVEGLTITGMVVDGKPVKTHVNQVTVPAGGQSRVDWLAHVEAPGDVTLKLVGRSDEYADAMEKSYLAWEHGVEKFIAKTGKVRGEAVTVAIDLPTQRQTESTTLTVQVASSMAVTMLDALPYLVDYPYGCTEQTMSRFLPAVVTAKTLQDMGLSPEDALNKVFGGIERQFVEKTHPKGAAKRANITRLDAITQQSLKRLYDFQHSDGGWGWWKKGDSDHFMTAYVLWGLTLARQSDLDVRGDVMDRAARYLQLEIVEEEANPDLQAWMLHALATYHDLRGPREVGEHETRAMANLWSRRTRLNAYTRALFALAAHHLGDAEKAQVLVRNLENGVKRDDAPDTSIVLGIDRRSQPAVIQTAHWGEDGIYWRWSDGGVEATAFALRALMEIEPEHELIEPVTNWLLKNRRGAQWSNTRDTAIVVLTMNDYLRASGELDPEFEYELLVNGNSIVTKKVTAAEALDAPSRYAIDPKYLRDGVNEVRIVRTNGAGAIYFAAEATYFSLEEPIPPAGSEIFLRRDYYKLVPRKTLLKGYIYDRQPLRDGDYVTSGERVEVVLTVEGKNNYEYLVFEDLKPAGLEAVEVRSGGSMTIRELKSAAVNRRFADGAEVPEQAAREPGMTARWHRPGEEYTGRSRWVHQELRDRKVALFVDRMPEGVWEIRYDLRAEVPGEFHALPVMGHAMYVPEIRGNSGETRITVRDRE